MSSPRPKLIRWTGVVNNQQPAVVVCPPPRVIQRQQPKPRVGRARVEEDSNEVQGRHSPIFLFRDAPNWPTKRYVGIVFTHRQACYVAEAWEMKWWHGYDPINDTILEPTPAAGGNPPLTVTPAGPDYIHAIQQLIPKALWKNYVPHAQDTSTPPPPQPKKEVDSLSQAPTNIFSALSLS